MADFQHRLQAFVKLGNFFREFIEFAKNDPDLSQNENEWLNEFDEKIALAGQQNGWFTQENVLFSLEVWSKLLSTQQLKDWLAGYNLKDSIPKNVAMVMAGNIPMVGFHDFLCAIITGNKVLVKQSSNDHILLPFIAKYLEHVEPDLKNEIVFETGQLSTFDAVIATGSNNTARYFEYYFSKKPNIIRKNRNSVALLTGEETQEQLQSLGEDIFRYYGLGCRSVSKLFVPENYNFDAFYEAIYQYKDIIDQQKYANNYDYNKAVYLMSGFQILDNGFLILKQDENYASPIASVFYETYTSIDAVKEKLENDQDKIQCIVAEGILENEVSFGQTQQPGLKDYADGIDTVEFLLKT